jgi:hypothetical protein
VRFSPTSTISTMPPMERAAHPDDIAPSYVFRSCPVSRPKTSCAAGPTVAIYSEFAELPELIGLLAGMKAISQKGGESP